MQKVIVSDELEGLFLNKSLQINCLQFVDSLHVNIESLCAQMSVRERDELNNITEQKRVDWMLGRIVAKRSIGVFITQYVGLCPSFDSIHIISGNGQRPTYITLGNEGVPTNIHKDIHTEAVLSISHCKGVALSNVVNRNTQGLVGVDVERIRSFRDETMRAFLTIEEYVAHQRVFESEKEKDITLRWCLKEAYLKAKGTGLRTQPVTIKVVLSDDSTKIRFFEAGTYVPTEVYWTTKDNLYILVSVTICV